MKRVKIAAAGFGATIAIFVAFTAWALESSGLAILETRAADGSTG